MFALATMGGSTQGAKKWAEAYNYAVFRVLTSYAQHIHFLLIEFHEALGLLWSHFCSISTSISTTTKNW
tara:strand:- start:219 stop:425 length:207 start_codon:yes stop_codon:yes gene_type:complete